MRRRQRRWIEAGIALLVALPTGGAAQAWAGAGGDGGGAAAERGPSTDAEGRAVAALRAVERRGEIRIDGRLGDEGWAEAPVIRDFVQGEPVEGARPEERTEVRVLFDDEAIYVGARMYEGEPGRVARQLVRRDETGQADYFQVSFDTNLDRRTGYQFRVSAAGVERDAYLYDDNRQDDSWDAVWQSDVRVDEEGWTAELRIPWSQIRYAPSDGPQTWGVNFQRWRTAAAERVYYALVPRNQHGRVSFFRPLEGVRVPERVRRIELRPYALTRAHTGPVDADDPFFDGRESDLQAGFDLRYGLGSAFTLDLAVNPDFGQVELDPAVINLSAFETYFPERRPFFVEDARILDFELSGHRNTLFYSRRIGREPQGEGPDDAEAADVPDQSTILGAAKLTGRTSGGLSVGGLVAATAEESARAFVPGTGGGEVVPFMAQPASYYGVARAQQDFRDGSTTVGGILTAVGRDLPVDGSFDFLPSDAYSAGVDVEHMWGDREWALEAFLAGSLVRGDTAALIGIQESSTHYFQRPDSDFTVDSSVTALAGAEWRVEVERRSGEHWTGGVWLAEVTPGFEVNDLGYSRSRERLDGGGRIGYREIEPGPLFREYSFHLSTSHNWRHTALEDPFAVGAWGRAYREGSVQLSGRGTLASFWSGSFDVSYSPQALSDGATRGGPLMVAPARVGTGLRLNTDPRAPLRLSGFVDLDRGEGGRSFRGGIGMRLRPTDGWEVQLEPRFTAQRDTDQYVEAFEDERYGATYGRRYLFGELERRSVSLETRLNVTFSPDLTLQLFAQPLIEAGAYGRYKQLEEPESFRFRPFTPGEAVDVDGDGAAEACAGGAICQMGEEQYLDFDGDGRVDAEMSDGDFNVVSLRGNAVLRWEYRPGSTIFLVWQQRRFDRREFGDFDFARDRVAMTDLRPDNVFIVKLNYWLGL